MTIPAVPTHRRRHLALSLLVFWIFVTVAWWALAFWPAESQGEWLLRTQQVCFGTLPNGLPDTWGWSMLIMAPGSMLGGLLAIYWNELIQDLAWLTRGLPGKAAAMVLAAVPAAGLVYVAKRIDQAAELVTAASTLATAEGPLPSDYPRMDKAAPDAPLLNQHGATITLAGLRGRPVLVTFAFAHCRTMCPLIIRTVQQMDRQMAAGGARPEVLIITLDPWRDTPASLPVMAKEWALNDRMHFLSGEVPVVEKLLNEWAVPRQRDEKTGEVNHPALVYLVSPEGRITYALNNPSVAWLAEATRRVAVK